MTATQTKETTQTQRTYIPGSPGTPVWGPQPGNPQQVNAPARPLTAAEKLAIRQAGIRQDIYGEQAPRGCGVFPMAPCPPEQTPTVQQASAPGTPGRTVTTTTVSIEEVIAQAKANPNEIGAASVEYLHVFGYTAYAYMWARMAAVALAKQGEGEFYQSKLGTARFYFARLLPRIHSLTASVKAGSESLYLLDAAQF